MGHDPAGVGRELDQHPVLDYQLCAPCCLAYLSAQGLIERITSAGMGVELTPAQ